MIYGRSSTSFYGSCELAATGPPARWRNLPEERPNWQAVYYYFQQWKQDGTFERINLALNQLDRKRVKKEVYPSVVCIDSQSRSAGAVKLSPMICEYRGTDAHKRVNGRKRQLVVDTQGRLWMADVHPANQADGPGAVSLIGDILWRAGQRLEKVYGDQSYNGVFAQELANWSIDFEKASRPESAQGFVPVAKRWVVEPVRRCGSIAWTKRTGAPVLSSCRQRLRIYLIFFGWLAVFNEHSDHATTNLTRSQNFIPQHVLMKQFFMRWLT